MRSRKYPHLFRIVALLFGSMIGPFVATAEDMIVVVGASGTDEYGEMFADWADQWKATATAANIAYQEIGRSGDNDYDLLKTALASEIGKTDGSPLWLVLLGHGTFDRNVAKFNLRGKDVEAKELEQWLQASSRPMILINGFSCSGAFLKPLHAPNRVVITATKNGSELNFARFGGYLAESLSDRSADLDHDDQVSLLEAFLLASSKVNQFYESDARLVTEHALLEDNHDGKGISADFFKGIRAQATAKDGAALDGAMAHRHIVMSSSQAVKLTAEQTAERDRIETQIEALRAKKSTMTEDDYYGKLEAVLLQMADLYASSTND